MKNLKLSKNFWLNEFTWSDTANRHAWIKKKSYPMFLLQSLADNIMQPIRNEFGGIRITNGIRNYDVWWALKDAGYKPSKRTDHSFGFPGVNRFGVGACDFIPKKKCDLWAIYNFIMKKLKFGQVIIYLDTKKNKYKPIFIHVSNPYKLVHSEKMIWWLPGKLPWLIHQGKGYELYNRKAFKKYTAFQGMQDKSGESGKLFNAKILQK